MWLLERLLPYLRFDRLQRERDEARMDLLICRQALERTEVELQRTTASLHSMTALCEDAEERAKFAENEARLARKEIV